MASGMDNTNKKVPLVIFMLFGVIAVVIVAFILSLQPKRGEFDNLTYKYALEALNAADDFMDDKKSRDEAHTDMDLAYDMLDGHDDAGKDFYKVKSAVLLCRMDLTSLYTNNAENRNSFLSSRNALANVLGEPYRKEW